MSLLLAAGLIVFVNRTENFKATNAGLTSELSRARAEVSAAKLDAAAQHGFAAAAYVARDTAVADGQKNAAKLQDDIAKANSAIADAQSNAKMLQVTQDNLTAALNASEVARTAQAGVLDSTRKDNNDLTTKYSQSQLAISDLTNKLEVATRNLTNSTETVAENKAEIETLQFAAEGRQPSSDRSRRCGRRSPADQRGGAFHPTDQWDSLCHNLGRSRCPGEARDEVSGD